MRKVMVLFVVLFLAPSTQADDSPKTSTAVAESPYGGAQSTPEAVKRSPEDGLRRVNFGLRIQNTRLTTELADAKLVLEDQNSRLISQVNQIAKLNTDLKQMAFDLGQTKSSREGLLKTVGELEKARNARQDKNFDDFFAVILLLSCLVAVVGVISLITIRIIVTLAPRIPTENQKEFIDSIGADHEAEREEHERELLRLRGLAKDEKSRADRIYEDLMSARRHIEEIESRNTKNAEAVVQIVDAQAKDFLVLVQGEKEKERQLRVLFERARELAEATDFENAKLTGRVHALRLEIDGLRQKLVSAEEKIVLLGGEEAIEDKVS